MIYTYKTKAEGFVPCHNFLLDLCIIPKIKVILNNYFTPPIGHAFRFHCQQPASC